jgi:tryptophan synthase beta subunit
LVIIKLKVPSRSIEKIDTSLARMDEVSGVFMTSGEANLTVRIGADDVDNLQRLITEKVVKRLDAEVVSSDVVTRVVKDSQGAALRPQTTLHLRCDYCHGEVTGERPYTVKVGPTYHYFCCRTCRKSFMEERGKRVRRVAARLAREETLQT